MITSVVYNRTTMLQVSLGLLANKSKLIQHLFEYAVTCSPDEIRRFKMSAAVDCARNEVKSQISITSSNDGLIQSVIDNYDTSISSQNGLQQTHSMGNVIAQPETAKEIEEVDETRKFPRLFKSDLKDVELPDIPMNRSRLTTYNTQAPTLD